MRIGEQDKAENDQLATAKNGMENEILQSLSRPQKQISAKYFYDQRGSELFELITQQAEYYPTRAEMEIFLTHADSIAQSAGPIRTLIEYGSGSSQKIKALISSFDSLKEYVPIDIAEEFLYQSSASLAQQFPDLSVMPVYGDYTLPLTLPVVDKDRKAIFFPGSTIGNFEPYEARAFLIQSSQLLDHGDGFIIGVDLKKDRQTLEAAYNDRNGITAQFNLNVLRRINRELGADFNLDQFEHQAFYNEEKGRIEMHLRSKVEQKACVANHVVEFRKGETIHTENSYKYGLEEFQHLAKESGFNPMKTWTDKNGTFSVHYLEKD